MRLAPNAFGFDTQAPQNANSSVPPPPVGTRTTRIEAMLRWMALHTNLSYAGGYITGTSPDWHPVFVDAWLAGWGLSLFYNDTIQTNNHQSGLPIVELNTHGRPDAALALKVADKVLSPDLVRAVVYFDVEESNVFSHSLNTYLRDLFAYLEEQPPAACRFRPGIYAHLYLLDELLQEFPYLYVCDNKYEFMGETHWDLESVNPIANPLRIEFKAGKFNLIPSMFGGGNLVNAAAGATRGPKRSWYAWPATFQFEGNNSKPMAPPPQPPQPFGSGTFNLFTVPWNNMDYQSALVTDPAYPFVSPRLAIPIGEPHLVKLTQKGPGDPLSLQGDLESSILIPDAPGRFSPPPVRQNSVGLLMPHHRPAWYRAGNHTVLVTARRDSWVIKLESHELVNSHLQALSLTTELLVHDRWAVAAFDSDHVALFCVRDGDLLLAKGDRSQWSPFSTIREGAVHTYSNLCATFRDGQSADCFFISEKRVLNTAWSNVNGTLGEQAIGSDPKELVPTTALAAVSPSPDSIVVVGVGFDLRLKVSSWTFRGGRGAWMGPYDVGKEGDLLAVHTDLSIVWNRNTQQIEVLAVSEKLKLCLYRLKPKDQTLAQWIQDGDRAVLFDPSVSVGDNPTDAPNPFGDLCLTVANNYRFVIAVFNIAPVPPGPAGPGRTVVRCSTAPAAAPPPPAPDWTDL